MGQVYELPMVTPYDATFNVMTMNDEQTIIYNRLSSEALNVWNKYTNNQFVGTTLYGSIYSKVYVAFYGPINNLSGYYRVTNGNGIMAYCDYSNYGYGVDKLTPDSRLPLTPHNYSLDGNAVAASGIIPYSTMEEAESAISSYLGYPITYRPTNCSFPNAPIEAAVGDTVVVPVTFPDGYGIVNDSDIYVTNNGVVIPSTYSNGQLTFTMPDPS